MRYLPVLVFVALTGLLRGQGSSQENALQNVTQNQNPRNSVELSAGVNFSKGTYDIPKWITDYEPTSGTGFDLNVHYSRILASWETSKLNLIMAIGVKYSQIRFRNSFHVSAPNRRFASDSYLDESHELLSLPVMVGIGRKVANIFARLKVGVNNGFLIKATEDVLSIPACFTCFTPGGTVTRTTSETTNDVSQQRTRFQPSLQLELDITKGWRALEPVANSLIFGASYRYSLHNITGSDSSSPDLQVQTLTFNLGLAKFW